MESAAGAGFGSITVSPVLYSDALAAGVTRERLRQRLQQLTLRVSMLDALTGSLPGAPPPSEIEAPLRRGHSVDLDEGIDTADALDIGVICLAPFRGRPVPRDCMARGIAELAARSRPHGLSLAIEFIPDTGIPDLRTAAAIIGLCGASNVGILLDVWHFARSGGTTADIEALPRDALLGVQLCDRRIGAEAGPYIPMSNRLLPGEGDLPVAGILDAALRNSPSAIVSLEVFSQELADLPSVHAAFRAAAALAKFRDHYESAYAVR
jgi:sugar phosphate isomerase/epimerase